MAKVDDMIEGVAEQIATKLKGVMQKYKNGKVTEGEVHSSIKRELDTFINSVRPSRSTEGQLLVTGRIWEPSSQELETQLRDAKLGKFIEFSSKRVGRSEDMEVRIVVLAAGVDLFLASEVFKSWSHRLSISFSK